MSNIYNKFIKRILDIIMGVIGIIVSIPIGLIISIILLITQGRPIFFSQIRIGLNGKKFKIYKFRTMEVEAEKMKEKFTEEEKREYNENFKLQNDCRITVAGKFLRNSFLDELPQFWNILKGDMSLIGPRPIVEKELEKYKEKKEKFLSQKPGLIGYWQAYANETTTYRERIKMELYYVDNVTFLFDLKLFFKSIIKVVSYQKNVYKDYIRIHE